MIGDASSPALRLSAGELELSIRNTIAKWLQAGEKIRELAAGRSAEELSNCSNAALIWRRALPRRQLRRLVDLFARAFSARKRLLGLQRNRLAKPRELGRNPTPTSPRFQN